MSSPGHYQDAVIRKPRSRTTDGWDSRFEYDDRDDDFMRVPGVGNENFLVRPPRRNSFSMENNRSEFTPPIPQPRKISKEMKNIDGEDDDKMNQGQGNENFLGTPRKNSFSMDQESIMLNDRSEFTPPIPKPRKISREEMKDIDAEDDDKMNHRIPTPFERNSVDSQEAEPDNYNKFNPDALDGVPSIMVHPDFIPTTPKQLARKLHDNKPVNDVTFGFRQGLTEDNTKTVFPEDNYSLNEEYRDFGGSLPLNYEGIYTPPSIADTSVSRNTFNTNMSTFPLTVDNKPNQEREVQEEEKVCSNFYVITAKWLAVILTAITVLVCVTANKICLLVIGYEYGLVSGSTNVSSSSQGDGKDRTKVSSKESIALMLIIIIMVPQAISLFYGVWGKRKSQKWPRKSAVLWVS
jgi:hypothetical protein